MVVTEIGRTTYILASILPSFKTYQYIARELNKFAGSMHPYYVWVSDHSSQRFDDSIAQMENFHNRLIITPTEEQIRMQYTIYQRAMELVLEMFYGLNFTEPTLVPLIRCHPDLILFSGFEFCCTQEDLCSTFFCPVSCCLESPVFISASQQLSELYEQGIKRITPIFSGAFSYTNLQQGLQQLSTFEKDATNNLIETGLLKGLSKACVENFGKSLVCENSDCLDLFSRLGKSANVISSFWCGGNILQEAFESDFLELGEVELHANKLCFEQSTCTGAFEKKVQSAMEKLAIFQEKIDKNCGLTIYIGDSVNDLLCMIKASIGIAVRPSSILKTVGTQFGITFVPLFSDLVEKLRERRDGSQSLWQPESGVVYTVSSWTELHSFIFGADKKTSNAALQFLPPKRSSKTLEERKTEKVRDLFKQLAGASSAECKKRKR